MSAGSDAGAGPGIRRFPSGRPPIKPKRFVHFNLPGKEALPFRVGTTAPKPKRFVKLPLGGPKRFGLKSRWERKRFPCRWLLGTKRFVSRRRIGRSSFQLTSQTEALQTGGLEKGKRFALSSLPQPKQAPPPAAARRRNRLPLLALATTTPARWQRSASPRLDSEALHPEIPDFHETVRLKRSPSGGSNDCRARRQRSASPWPPRFFRCRIWRFSRGKRFARNDS